MQSEGFKKGPVNRARNRFSGKSYLVSTARETKGDYWTIVVLKLRLKIFPSFMHPVVSFVRNSEEDAIKAHQIVKIIVETLPESNWIAESPSALPLEGLTNKAQEKLNNMN